MTQIPNWAEELNRQVCKDHRRAPAKLNWKQCQTYSSSGVTYIRPHYRYRSVLVTSASGYKFYSHKKIRGSRYDITVRAGSDIKDQRLVLLHELAHYLLAKSKKGRREHHSLRFWRLAFKLYKNYGVDLEYAYDREKHYKTKASWAYAEIAKQ